MLPFWKLKITGRHYYTVNINESNIFCCCKQTLKASPALKSLLYQPLLIPVNKVYSVFYWYCKDTLTCFLLGVCLPGRSCFIPVIVLKFGEKNPKHTYMSETPQGKIICIWNTFLNQQCALFLACLHDITEEKAHICFNVVIFSHKFSGWL